MLLDDLVTAIQTVKDRIREHGNSLSQNEYRTRIALIDPILNALGWDVSDSKFVTIEDQYSGGRPDYALLGKDVGKPLAFIEAKRLGESLDAHNDQVFKYTWDRKVFYAGLTDGNRWILRDVIAEFSHPPRQALLLDVNISGETSYKTALKLLLLWNQSLLNGEPVEANEPILAPPVSTEAPPTTPEPTLPTPPPRSVEAPSSEWISLTDFNYKGNKPSKIRLPDGQERNLRSVIEVLKEIAEWLVRTGELTKDKCPIRAIVNTEPRSEGGARYTNFGSLSNDLIFNKGINGPTTIRYAIVLTQHLHQDPSSILLKSS